MVARFKGGPDLIGAAGLATRWNDSGTLGQDLDVFDLGFQPSIGLDAIDGVPCMSLPVAPPADKYLRRATNMLDRFSNPITAGGRTVLQVVRPIFSAPNFGIIGGPSFTFFQNTIPQWGCLFDLESNFVANGAYLWSSAWRDPAFALQATPIAGGALSPFNAAPTLLEWNSLGHPDINVKVNNVQLVLAPAVQYPAVTGASGNAGFMMGNVGTGGVGLNFQGNIAETIIYDYKLSTAPAEYARTLDYLRFQYPSLVI